MSKDLLTSIVVFIVGILISYFACDLFLPEIASVKIETVNTGDYSIVDPDPEIFNYRAINPTVETYVGECDRYDEFGNCIVEEPNVNPEDNNGDNDDNDNPNGGGEEPEPEEPNDGPTN